MKDSTDNKKQSVLINILINLICNIPILKSVLDKEILIKKTEKINKENIYISVLMFFVLLFPLTQFFFPSKKKFLFEIQFSSFFANHILLFYTFSVLLVFQIWITTKLFMKNVGVTKHFVILTMFCCEFFFLKGLCESLVLENKYYCGPLYARHLYLNGKYDEALSIINIQKKDARWKHLSYELNKLENRIYIGLTFSDKLESSVLNMGAQKNYIGLLDLLVFEKKICPASVSQYQCKVIQDQYNKTISNINNNINSSSQAFSEEELLLRKFFNNRPLGLMKYDSTLLAEYCRTEDRLNAIKYIMNDELITAWINQIQLKQ